MALLLLVRACAWAPVLQPATGAASTPVNRRQPRSGSLLLSRPLQERRHRLLARKRKEYQHEEDTSDTTDNDNILISLLDSLTNVASAPTPGLGEELPLVYPLALAAAAIFLPVPTSALLVIFFVAFRWLGSQVGLNDGDDDGESIPVNLPAFVASILSAALLAPESGTGSGSALPQLVSLAALVLAASILGQQTPESTARRETEELSLKSSEQLRMDLWDQELEKQTSSDDPASNNKR